jgi:Tfp pilus assembly protein PilV
MKCLCKTVKIIKDNSGETIAEVLVAFILLTIMLLFYAQGIALATKSEMNANKSRTGADEAMKQVQDDIAARNSASEDGRQVPEYLDERIRQVSYSYTIDGKTYTYVYYEPIRLSDG